MGRAEEFLGFIFVKERLRCEMAVEIVAII